MANKELKCWGSESLGILGTGVVSLAHIGDEPNELGSFLQPIDLGTSKKVLKIACTSLHHCALLEDGEVKCWGYGLNGVLGSGSEANIGDGPGQMGDSLSSVDLGLSAGVAVDDICVGSSFSCALLDNGQIKCWGDGSSGVLGQGNGESIGDAPGEMGASLPTIDFGEGRTVLQLACGLDHACVLLDNRQVKCWGRNSGYIDEAERGFLGIDKSDEHVGVLPNSMGDNLPFVDLGRRAIVNQIVAGGQISCALLQTKEIKCWGAGELGALGQGNRDDIVGLEASTQMGDNLPSIDIGENRSVVEISLSGDHVCALLESGEIVCWGSGGALGDVADIGGASGEMGDNLEEVDLGFNQTVLQVSAGPQHSCALLASLEVKCWGSGRFGKLGQGNTTDYGPGLGGGIGDALDPVDLDGLVRRPLPRVSLPLVTFPPEPENTGEGPLQLAIIAGAVAGACVVLVAASLMVFKYSRSPKPNPEI